MRDRDSELARTLPAMEDGFQARLIATFDPDLVCAPAEAGVLRWLEDADPDLAQFPVRDGDPTVGVLLRGQHPAERSVREVMLPLRGGLVVAGDLPIADLIPQLRECHYRLVVRDSRIDGLVTESDLLRLPVRALLFSLVTHLEQVMADFITDRWENSQWMEMLQSSRQEKIIQKEADLRKKGMNPPRIELTDFCDKRELIASAIGHEKKKFVTAMRDIEDLRNQLAHASTFILPDNLSASVTILVDNFEAIRHWTVRLETIDMDMA